MAWLRDQMLAARLWSDVGLDGTAGAIHQELLEAYNLINKVGVGIVYFGSARLDRESPYWWVLDGLGIRRMRAGGPTPLHQFLRQARQPTMCYLSSPRDAGPSGTAHTISPGMPRCCSGPQPGRVAAPA